MTANKKNIFLNFIFLVSLFSFSLEGAEKKHKASNAPAEAQTAAALSAQAMADLQKGDKAAALKLLERAFEVSTDPDEIKDIGVLILEASPLTYPKRESYLRYLIKNYPEHADLGKWVKEMGDRNFDAGKFDEAEELYLRALDAPETDKSLIRYKLAWVDLNLKRKEGALNRLLDLFETAGSQLQSQIKKDIPKIWAEIGRIPDPSFQKLIGFDAADVREMTNRLIESISPQITPTDQDEDLLLQLKENDKTRDVLSETLQRGALLFVKDPCFLFSKVIQPGEVFSSHLLLACQNATKRKLSAEKLIPYYSGLPPTEMADEKVIWAYADALMDAKRLDDAANLLLQPDISILKLRSKDHLAFVESVLLKLDETSFKAVAQTNAPEKFESILQLAPNDHLLIKLQGYDPARWIQFEENRFDGRTKKPTKEFLVKKGLLLAEQNTAIEEKQKLFEDLLKTNLVGNEIKVRDRWKLLKARLSTRMPGTFTPAFKTAYDSWLKDLDDCLKTLRTSSDNWQVIATPVFKEEIQKNVQAILAQINSVTLDPELKNLSDVFEKKKDDLRDQLQKRYLSKGED